MTVFNWDDLTKAADDAGFEAVPAGEYDVEVATAEAAKTGGNNGGTKDKIKVKFKIENGPHAGKSLFNDFVLSPENPNALGFFFRHMAALGLTREYFQGNPSLPVVAAALVGRRCRVKVSIRMWDEQERNQVDKVLPPLGGAAASGIVPAASAMFAGQPVPSAVPGGGYVPTPGMVPATSAGTPGFTPGPVPTPMPMGPAPMAAPAPVPTPAPVPQPAAPPVDATVQAQAQAAADVAQLNATPEPPPLPF
jgi:hypothetical protein